MKYLCVLLVLCAAASVARSEEVDKTKLENLTKECKDEAGASDADVDSFLKHEPASGTEAKCMRACVLKKLNVLTADGKMNKQASLEVVKALAKGDEAREKLGSEIVEKCAALEVPDDHCEAAEKYRACYHQHVQEQNLGDLEF